MNLTCGLTTVEATQDKEQGKHGSDLQRTLSAT